MLHRSLFIVVALFFLIMNTLLWRAEISNRNKAGSPVPFETVFAKILTAPDHSSLEIRHHQKKIGYCRWSPNVGQELATGVRMAEGPPPDGMIRQVSNYTLDFDGGVTVFDSSRVRFNFNLRLTTNHVWEHFHLRLNLRPTIYTLEALQGEETLVLTTELDDKISSETITFADLKKPATLLTRFGGPILPQLIRAAGLPLFNPHTTTPDELNLGLDWSCRNDWMQIGHARLRVYRLQADLLDQFRIVVLVSHVGEILRIELPDEIIFVNEALSL